MKYKNHITQAIYEILCKNVNENYAKQFCEQYKQLSPYAAILKASLQLDSLNFSELSTRLGMVPEGFDSEEVQEVIKKVAQNV